MYYVDICFDLAKCEVIVKNRNLKMLVVLSPIFVADTKITFVYNFVAPINAHVKPVYETQPVFEANNSF